MTFGIWAFQVRLTGTRIFTNNVINKACINRCNKLFVFDGPNDTLIERIYLIETLKPVHQSIPFPFFMEIKAWETPPGYRRVPVFGKEEEQKSMKKKWIRQALTLLLISILVFEPVPSSALRISPVLSAAAEEKDEDSEAEKEAKKKEKEKEEKEARKKAE